MRRARGADARGAAAAVWMLGRRRRGVCVGNQTRGVSMSENKAPAVRPSGDAAVVVADVPVVKTDGFVVSVCEVALPVGPVPVGTGRWSV